MKTSLQLAAHFISKDALHDFITSHRNPCKNNKVITY